MSAFVSPSLFVPRHRSCDKRRIRTNSNLFMNVTSVSTVPSRRELFLCSHSSEIISKHAIQAIRDVYSSSNAAVHRGSCAHHLGKQAALLMENAREKVANALSIQNPNHVIFASSPFEATSILAKSFTNGLEPFDEIVIAASENDHTILPWKVITERKQVELRFANADMSNGGSVLFEQFAPYMSPQTKLIVLQYACPLFGCYNPIEEVIQVFQDVGVKTAVDITHSLPLGPIDINNLNADFVIAGGSAIGALPSSAFLTGQAQALNQLAPCGGAENSLEETTNDATVDFYRQKRNWAPLPERLEMGMPSLSAAVGLATAVEARVNAFDDRFIQRVQDLAAYLHDRVRSCPSVEVYGEGEENLIPTICFNLKNISADIAADKLAQNGIRVDSGCHGANFAHSEELQTSSSLLATFDPTVHDVSDIDNFVDQLQLVC